MKLLLAALILIMLLYARMFYNVYECGEIECETTNSWSMA